MLLDKTTGLLFKNSGLTLEDITKAASSLCLRKIDFGDLFFERVTSESFMLEEGIIKDGSFDISQGVGVRAVSGGKTGFAYSDSFDMKSLMEACAAARSISHAETSGIKIAALPQDVRALYSDEDPLLSLPRARKIAALETLDKCARDQDPRVTQVMASLHCSHRCMLVMDTEGRISCDIKPVTQIVVNVTMEGKGRTENGFAAAGGAFMLERICSEEKLRSIALEAVRSAAVNLEAQSAPAGQMPVVLGAGWPGVLIHEAVGHGLEGDFNRTGSSNFTGRIGQQVASKACTIIDDGTIPERRGSQSCDDEGTPTGRNVLIENGILKNYMQDRQNAMLMGMQPTGNGRRESYNTLPIPRMTNTFMLPGEFRRDEIIESVEKGIYAVNFRGGQVDITSGKFVFSTSEAYLIEHGRITAPIKGATLIGNGPETMKQVSMVADDLKFDDGIGTCGKAGQSVAVGIGTPTLKIDSITVGGTQA